jgi:hypothetical protein
MFDSIYRRSGEDPVVIGTLAVRVPADGVDRRAKRLSARVLAGTCGARANLLPVLASLPVRRLTRASSILGAACALCLLGGCGGGSSKGTTAASTTTSSSRPTQTAYLASANTICRSARMKTGALIAQLEVATTSAIKAPSASAIKPLAALVSALHQAASVAVTELQSLPRPEGSQGGVEDFLTPLSGAVTSLGQAEASLAAGHAQQALGTLLSLQTLTPQLAAAAHRAGLGECESVLSAGS